MDRIEQISNFLAATPGDSFLQHALALEYIKLNDPAKARALFEQILTRDPGYIGSYYHLAKVLDLLNEPELAQQWRQKGMQEAKNAGDAHAYNELSAAFSDVADE